MASSGNSGSILIVAGRIIIVPIFQVDIVDISLDLPLAMPVGAFGIQDAAAKRGFQRSTLSSGFGAGFILLWECLGSVLCKRPKFVPPPLARRRDVC